MANKFSAQKVRIGDLTFDSRAEARRWEYLKACADAGEIEDLDPKPKYKLFSQSGVKVGEYWPDFRYRIPGRGTFVEDVKGYVLPNSTAHKFFRIKAKIFEADYKLPLIVIPTKDVLRIPPGGLA